MRNPHVFSTHALALSSRSVGGIFGVFFAASLAMGTGGCAFGLVNSESPATGPAGVAGSGGTGAAGSFGSGGTEGGTSMEAAREVAGGAGNTTPTTPPPTAAR